MNTLSVNLTNDLVFKAIFGKAGNEHLVLSLINAIRGDKNLPLVSEVELKSPVAAILFGGALVYKDWYQA